MPEPTTSVSPPSRFEQRLAVWADLHARFGPARSYPYAWRLPELARGEGISARFRAALALARTLYAMGRFAEALGNLPEGGGTLDDTVSAAESLDLRARCLWLLGETEAARSQAEGAWAAHRGNLARLKGRVGFLFLSDSPRAALPLCRDYREAALAAGADVERCRAVLLAAWAESRLGRSSIPGPIHRQLAAWRRVAPAEAAEGEAWHAEAVFHLAPAASLVWLDHALARADCCGQHHLKARLLHLKSRALDAAGQLGEAGRFLQSARETARRQGAWRYLRDMAG